MTKQLGVASSKNTETGFPVAASASAAAYVFLTPASLARFSLRFIQTRHDLPALTARDANADPLLDMSDFQNPPFMKPPKLDPKRGAECPQARGRCFLLLRKTDIFPTRR